jgi:lipopolysaccharide transport system permease protein
MATLAAEKNDWKEIITPSNSIFYLNLKELWGYRDLLLILVRRDISSIYKQTILGPLWFFLQPILTTVTYIIIFSRVAKFSTAGLPPVLFYLSGIILWGYFAECVIKTSSFLKDNTGIFTKVYFPRLIVPLSIILTTLVKFAIQFGLFLMVYLYFYLTTDSVSPSYFIFLLPVLIICIALLGLGAGIIVASLTIRYKDLSHLITFAIQLLMFVSTVFFPLNSIADGIQKKIIMANPMSGFIEAFRYIFTGTGYLNWSLLGYDLLCVVVFLFIGIILFNHSEKAFVDTI